MRNGTGSPALCRAHRLVAKDAAQQAPPRVSTAFQHVQELFDDFVAGRRVDAQKIGDIAAQAINEFAWSMGGGFTGFHPPIVNEADIRDAEPGGPGPGYRQRQRRARPSFFDEGAPFDPEAAQKERDRTRARQILGFGPQEAITREILKQRFRTLAKKHHPDRKGGSLERMKEVSWANDVLEKAIP